jgi:inner membrane protein
MPSPIGHLIAGATIGYALAPRRPAVVALCAAVATSPDLDLVVSQTHRTATHSVTALALVTILAIAVTGGVTAQARVVAALSLAYASHLLLDWLAADPTPPQGIQLLWPFSDAWYISGWDLFRGTARRNPFTPAAIELNAKAIAQEIAILGPIAWVVFRLRS